MARFITTLKTGKVKEARGAFGRATWELLAPLVYSSDVVGVVIIVPAGFTTDFASVPRLPLIYSLAGDTGHASAVVHDYLCRTKKLPRVLADKVFREALEVEGVPAWRRTLMYLGVRIGGAGK